MLDAAADAIEDWARDGAYKAANKWNAWLPPASPDDPNAPDGPEAPDSPPQPDSKGIVRHATGWRKLLRRG